MLPRQIGGWLGILSVLRMHLNRTQHLMLQAPMCNRRRQNGGFSVGHVVIRLGHADTQVQHLAAQRRGINLIQQFNQGVVVYRAITRPDEPVAGQQIGAKIVKHFMQCITLQAQLRVYLNLIEESEFGLTQIAIGDEGQRNNSRRRLRTVLWVFTHDGFHS